MHNIVPTQLLKSELFTHQINEKTETKNFATNDSGEDNTLETFADKLYPTIIYNKELAADVVETTDLIVEPLESDKLTEPNIDELLPDKEAEFNRDYHAKRDANDNNKHIVGHPDKANFKIMAVRPLPRPPSPWCPHGQKTIKFHGLL